MYTVFGFDTPNVQKVIFTLEELELPYRHQKIDLTSGEQKSPEHLARHCWGKVPVLEHDEGCLIESNAICRLLARSADHRLYAAEPRAAYEIDAMIDMLAFHPGRWILSYFFEDVIRPKFFSGAADPEALKEADGFLARQLPEIDRRLSEHPFLCGETISLADTIGFPVFNTSRITSCDLSAYSNIERWIDELGNRPSWQRSKTALTN